MYCPNCLSSLRDNDSNICPTCGLQFEKSTALASADLFDKQIDNNLHRMKTSIISQIEKMSVREFQNFVVLLSNSGIVSKTIINLSEVLTCDDCREKYGGCNAEETNDCDKRFIKFSVEKVEKDIEH